MRLLLVEPYGGALRLIFSSFVRFPAAIDGRPPASLWTKKREINWNASLPAGGPGRLWEGAARRRSAGRSPAERAGGADSNICFWDWRVKTIMSLQKVYSPYCRIGAAVSAQAFERPAALRALAEQYNSLTCENDMKPECLLDEAENCENPDAHCSAPPCASTASSTILCLQRTPHGDARPYARLAQPDAALVLHGALQPLAFRPARRP